MEKAPITIEGYQALKDELKHLIKVERPKVIGQIAEARAHGDLKENAEYHAAREKQGFVEGRIQRINFLLANSEAIDISNMSGDTVRFGATVTYENVDTEEQTTWQLVGEEETDIKKRKISIMSPIARALVGKKAGDEVSIKAPKGAIEVELLAVKYN